MSHSEVMASYVSKETGKDPAQLAYWKYLQCNAKSCGTGDPDAVLESFNSMAGSDGFSFVTQYPTQLKGANIYTGACKIPDGTVSSIKTKARALVKQSQVNKRTYDTKNDGNYITDNKFKEYLQSGPVIIAVNARTLKSFDGSNIVTMEQMAGIRQTLGSKAYKAPNHVITLVGYGVDAKGKEYWKIKNSWYGTISSMV
jgi:hypothetical protein